MAVITAVTSVLLLHFDVDTVTDCRVVSTGLRGNLNYAYSYCSTVKSLCCG